MKSIVQSPLAEQEPEAARHLTTKGSEATATANLAIPGGVGIDALMALQARAGNRAVTDWLNRKRQTYSGTALTTPTVQRAAGQAAEAPPAEDRLAEQPPRLADKSAQAETIGPGAPKPSPQPATASSLSAAEQLSALGDKTPRPETSGPAAPLMAPTPQLAAERLPGSAHTAPQRETSGPSAPHLSPVSPTPKPPVESPLAAASPATPGGSPVLDVHPPEPGSPVSVSEVPAAAPADELPQGRPDLDLPPEPAAARVPLPNGPAADLMEAVEAEQRRIEKGAEQAGAKLSEAARQQKALIEETFTEQHRSVAGGFASFHDALRQSAATETAAAQSKTATATAAIRKEAAVSVESGHGRVAAMESTAAAAGETQAGRAIKDADERIGAVRPSSPGGDADIQSGVGHISDAVSQRARAELTSAGARAAANVKDGVRQLQDNLYTPARNKIADAAGSAADDAEQALRHGMQTATTAVGNLTGHATKAGYRAHQTLVSGLELGRKRAHSEVDRWAEAGRRRLLSAAKRLGRAVVGHARAFAASVSTSRAPKEEAAAASAEATQQAQEATDQTVRGLDEVAAGLAQGVVELGTAHVGAARKVTGQVAHGLQHTESAALGAQRRAGAAFAVHADEARASAQSDLGQLPTRAAAGLESEHRTGMDRLGKTVDDAGSHQERWTRDAKAQAEAGGQRFAGEAERLGSQAQSSGRAPVQGIFESFIGPLRKWLQHKLGDVLGGIVSGVIQALPAIIIAVALLLAGPVGWVVLAGLVLVGAGLTIYARFQEYKADHGGQGPSFWQGVGLVALGIADLTGIPYIVEAIAGRRAFSPTPMSTFERYERGTQGVIFLALLLTGGAKKLFGRGAPVEVPIDEPPVEVEPKDPIPDEVPSKAGQSLPFDPEKVPIDGEGNRAKFDSVKQLINRCPAARRAEVAKILFKRMTAETGGTWNAVEHAGADGGTYWTGEGAPFIYAIDPTGNAFQGRIGPDTFIFGPDGMKVNYSSSTLTPQAVPAGVP